MSSYERATRFINSDNPTPTHVYINNMNIRHATVTLPGRSEIRNFNTGKRASHVPPNDHYLTSSYGRASKNGKDYSNEQHRVGRSTVHTFGSNYNQQRIGGLPGTANGHPTSFNADDSHETNMKRIYNRIMQRLQHEMNYNDLNRIPLYDQYRVDLDLKELDQKHGEGKLLKDPSARSAVGEERANPTGSRFQSRRDSLGSSINTGRDEKTTTSSAELSQRQSCSPQNESSSFSSKKVIPAPRRTLPSVDSRPSTQNSIQDGMSKLSTCDVELSLALQPCPLPLQLVVHHVRETVAAKMQLAETSSLENCIRFVFESRALLDRLLREIPIYSSYPPAELVDTGRLPYISRQRRETSPGNAVGSDAERSGTVGGLPNMRLQDLFQRFNKKPVLLPRGRYVQDEETGAVYAELDHSQEVALQKTSSPVFKAHLNPSQPLSTSQIRAASQNGSGGNSPKAHVAYDMYLKRNRDPGADAFEPSSSALDVSFTPAPEPALQLPPTYGKSSRLFKGADAAESQHKGPWPGQRAGPSTAASRLDTTPHELFPSSALTSTTLLKSSLTHSAGLSLSQGKYPEDASLLPAPIQTIARQTVNVATMTEVTDETRVITLADYTQLEGQVAALQLALEESLHASKGLAEKLQEASSYTERRARIIQYLRETLMQECNLLRRQLAMPGRREPRSHNGLPSIRLVENGNANHSGHERTSGHSTPINNGLLSPLPGASFASRSPQMGLSRASALFSFNNPTSPGVSNSNSHATPSESHTGKKGSLLDYGKHGILGANPTGSGTQTPHLPTHDAGGNTSLNHEISTTMASQGANNPHSAASCGATQDLTSIQSLIDLTLLAVEGDKTLTASLGELEKLKGIPGAFEGVALEMDSHTRLAKVRAEFEGKLRRLRESFLTERLMHSHVSDAKDKEIARLRGLIDLRVMQNTLGSSMKDLRKGMQRLRSFLLEELQSFRGVLQATVASLLNFVKLLSETRQESEVLEHSLGALRHLVESAYALLQPMLTEEYKRGYHPWPLRLRNTQDPFSHVVKVQYGLSEVVRLREPIHTLNMLYASIHRFAMGQIVIPEAARPAYGRPLQLLCSGIALSWSSSVNLILEVRQRYQNEIDCCRQMAKINVQIMWNVYLQNAYSERSFKAIMEGDMNPYTTTLPVGKRVNELAAQRGVLVEKRNAIYKERMENARCVYRMWRERNIEISSREIPIVKQSNMLPALAEQDSDDNSRAGLSSLSPMMHRESKQSSDVNCFSGVPLTGESISEEAESSARTLQNTVATSWS